MQSRYASGKDIPLDEEDEDDDSNPEDGVGCMLTCRALL